MLIIINLASTFWSIRSHSGAVLHIRKGCIVMDFVRITSVIRIVRMSQSKSIVSLDHLVTYFILGRITYVILRISHLPARGTILYGRLLYSKYLQADSNLRCDYSLIPKPSKNYFLLSEGYVIQNKEVWVNF